MNKNEVLKKLCIFFNSKYVWGWLDKFPDDHVFDDKYNEQVIDYINSLPVFPSGVHDHFQEYY